MLANIQKYFVKYASRCSDKGVTMYMKVRMYVHVFSSKCECKYTHTCICGDCVFGSSVRVHTHVTMYVHTYLYESVWNEILSKHTYVHQAHASAP